MKRVGIIGIGCVPARATSPDLSYRELIYEAAVKAYEMAGIEPNDVGTFVGVSEDFTEGVSIYDEYVPDEIGAVLKPVHTISGDGLMGIASVYMQIQTGWFKIGVVEAHSKASNVLNYRKILELAYDPIYLRHLNLDPHYLAGLEMRSYMNATGITEEEVARVTTEMRKNALWNPFAAYPGKFKIEDVLNTDIIAEPLREGMIANHADGAIVVVLADDDVVRGLNKSKETVWIDGISFYTSEPSYDTWDWCCATYAKLSAIHAYKMARINCPLKELSLVEVDCRYAYKFFQHLEAIQVTEGRCPAKLLEEGFFSKEGVMPANLSGAHLGIGLMEEATCLYQLKYALSQLLGKAGENQLKDPHKALIQSWRGFPTRTGATIIISNE